MRFFTHFHYSNTNIGTQNMEKLKKNILHIIVRLLFQQKPKAFCLSNVRMWLIQEQLFVWFKPYIFFRIFFPKQTKIF